MEWIERKEIDGWILHEKYIVLDAFKRPGGRGAYFILLNQILECPSFNKKLTVVPIVVFGVIVISDQIFFVFTTIFLTIRFQG